METINQKSKTSNSQNLKGDLVKGFKDKIGKEGEKAIFIQELAKQVFEKYNYNYIETPIIESEKFVRGENTNDEAVSDIFKLQDRAKRKLALRYELTFQLKRVFTNQKLPYKRFQIGPVFRDEPTTGNRLKQFTQCDIDIIGAKIKDQAELLSAFSEILNSLKVEYEIFVNNRKLLNRILEELKIKKKEEAIRELDKIDKLTEKEVKENLKNFGAEKLIEILKQPIEKFKQYEEFKEIEELINYCKMYGVKITFSLSLARGLSYYTGNVFEIKSKIKETICGGGTYEIKGIESTGISFSIERMMAVTNVLIDIEKILVVSLNKDKKAIDISKILRAQGKNASVFFGKPSKALEYANSYGIKKVLFVGEKEIEKKKYKIKNMQTGKEVIVEIEKKKKVKL